MGRRRYFYALIAAVALSCGLTRSLFAQVPGDPAPARVAPVQGAPEQPARPQRDPLLDMSAEERLRFQSNIERWRQMPPEERRELREREGWRQQRLKREAEAAIRETGLQLERDKREQFERRYVQERKRIEQALRQEIKEKRQRELAPVVERLKKEFSQNSPTPSPAASSAK